MPKLYEEGRFATWHQAWKHLGLEQRRRMLRVIANDPEPVALLSDNDVLTMAWIVPRSVGGRPDGILTYLTPAGDPRVWAVLEYKLSARLNSPRRASVLGVPDSEPLPVGIDPELDESAYRHPGYRWRIPQLVAYYHARTRILRHHPTDDATLWRVLAPTRWPPRNARFCHLPDQHEPKLPSARPDGRIREIPDVWQHVPLAGPLAVFTEALAAEELGTPAHRALVDAITAIPLDYHPGPTATRDASQP